MIRKQETASCKRHTARCVASACSAVLSLGGRGCAPVQPGGNPILSGVCPQLGLEYPPAQTGVSPAWNGVPLQERTWDQKPGKESGTGVCPHGQTDTCGNSTFPILRMWAVKMYLAAGENIKSLHFYLDVFQLTPFSRRVKMSIISVPISLYHDDSRD